MSAELIQFLLDTMPDAARVHEDDDVVVRSLDELDDLVQDELLGLRVVGWRLGTERRLEARGRNAHIRNVRGQHDVYWPCL